MIKLSVIVVFFNIHREFSRTLYTLSPCYQLGISPDEYEVLIVDTGSVHPLSLQRFDSPLKLRLLFYPSSPSPAEALNYAIGQCLGSHVMICIDGARMLSPRLLSLSIQALQARPNCLVATLGWHLGLKPQYISIDEGYNTEVEDELLASVNWKNNGYELFTVASLAGSSNNGWFMPISESNCICLSRYSYYRIGGFDERFQSAGGGLVNLDFFKRACEYTNDLVILLGEGTFHQFHGGVSTNVSIQQSPFANFHDEYVRIKGHSFSRPTIAPTYYGTLPPQCLPFLQHSLTAVFNA